MASLMLDASVPSRPYSSLRATIGIAIILHNFRKCLKARLRREQGAGRTFPTAHGGTWRRRVTSQASNGWEHRRSPRVRRTWPAFSSSESRDLWFRSLLHELDKYTSVGRTPLWKTAADEKIFFRHDSSFGLKNVGIREVAYYFSIVTAVLGRLDHCRQHASAQSPFTHGHENEVDEVDYLDDEKFVANLEHLLRCLANLLYELLVQKTIELLDLEALYWQQHLDDELFAEKPGRRQQLSSTWPWTIRTALLVLWGVCWMFFDFWEHWPAYDRNSPGDAPAASVDLDLTPNADVVPPELSWHLSERFIISAAPQPTRQQGYENESEHENVEPHLCIFNSKGGQRPDGYELYNHGRLPQDSLAFGFGTGAASTWPDTSGSSISDLNTDAWPNRYNQLCQSLPPVREGAPFLTLQAPDADFPALAPDIHSPHLKSLEEEEYDPPMPDSDNYPSPASEGLGARLHSKNTSPDPSPVMTSIKRPDQTSPSSLGSLVRPRLSLKRDQEPPRNDGGQIICTHPGCSCGKPPTFQRKCEWSKHMDKHDRPYICTESGCEKIRGFTYSGGLLRHQREVHKKHGGPKAPFICPHQDCKRSTGKGFTRRENLVEHLRRVHRKDAPDHATTHEHRTGADRLGDDAEPDSLPALSQKRKRSLDDTEARPDLYAPSTVPDAGGGDLREEVKRLKRQNADKDRRLRDLEAFVATLK